MADDFSRPSTEEEKDLIIIYEIDDGMAEDSDIGGDSDPEDFLPLIKHHSSLLCTASTSTSTNITCDAIEDLVAEPYYISPGIPTQYVDYSSSSSEEENTPFPNYTWTKNGGAPKQFSSTNFNQEYGGKYCIDTNSPYKIFASLLEISLMTEIINQSNLYAIQKGNTLDLTLEELNAFLGLVIIMGFHRLPSIRHYWSNNLNFRVTRVMEVMSMKRFLHILRFLHINDNSSMPKRGQKDFDRLYKIRPMIRHLNNSFAAAFSPSRFLSIDESMAAFKGRTFPKQYMPMKPIKRGFKIWAISCGVTGYMLGFQVYEGKTDNSNIIPLGEKVVLELSEAYQHLGYCLFFDNFFSSLPLLQKLLNNGLFGCGTIRPNRKYFPTDLVGNKHLEIGEFDAVNSGDLSVYKLKDYKRKKWSRSVTVCSNMHDIAETDTVIRKNKKGEREIVQYPKAIADYNRYKGGVDNFDQMTSIYNIAWKSRRWWIKLFYYFIEATICNSFILYRERMKAKKEKPMTHLNFRSLLADELIGEFSGKKVSKVPKMQGVKKKSTGLHKQDSIRHKKFSNHLPIPGTWRRCAYCSTTTNQKRSNLICSTCEVALCKRCFAPYHTK